MLSQINVNLRNQGGWTITAEWFRFEDTIAGYVTIKVQNI